MLNRYRDVFVGTFLIICSIGFYIYSFSIKTMAVARIGPAFVPKLICLVIAFLSILLIITELIKIKKNQESVNDKDKDDKKILPVLGTIVLIIAYISLLNVLGFIIMTMAYLILQCSLLDPQRSLKNVLSYTLISLVVSFSTYYLFVNVFQLMLPAGIIG